MVNATNALLTEPGFLNILLRKLALLLDYGVEVGDPFSVGLWERIAGQLASAADHKEALVSLTMQLEEIQRDCEHPFASSYRGHLTGRCQICLQEFMSIAKIVSFVDTAIPSHQSAPKGMTESIPFTIMQGFGNSFAHIYNYRSIHRILSIVQKF